MKRLSPLIVIALILTCVLAPVAWAAANRADVSRSDRSPGAPLSHAVSTVTGIAISPLLGTGALGMFQWWHAKDEAARAALPWYAQPKFWIPALLIVLVCATKDSFGAAVPPMLKKPLDILEVAENKFSGLIAAGAVVPFAMDAFSKLLLESANSGGGGSGGLAMIQSLGVNWAPALDLITVPLGIAMFVIVWMASHAINVLILLSPWGAIDAALKAGRTALLGFLTMLSATHPVLGGLLALALIVVSYFIAGWSFRLTVYGTVMTWEYFTRRQNRFLPGTNANRLFSGAAFPGVPIRTYGTLRRGDTGQLEFAFRPWLVLKPRVTALPVAAASLTVGEGLFQSVVLHQGGGTFFLLPPRYRGHEQELVNVYGLAGVQPAGLRKAWGSLRELVGGRPGTPALASTPQSA